MLGSTCDDRRRLESLDRDTLSRRQLERLNDLFGVIFPENRFYREKLRDAALPLSSLAQLSRLPYTTKDELAGQPAAGDFAVNRTFALERYVRYHRTSGTRGRPLVVLDTPEDWQGWIETWQFVLDVADIQPGDRALLAFSFGPFIGFWSAHDALLARGAMAIPSGGLSTLARLDLLRNSRATALFCTPSYALHLAEVAAEQRLDLPSFSVRRIVVAGEPGGSIPAIRDRIEAAWQARVVDHCGATEVGPWGVADVERRGLHVIESEFLAEFPSLDAPSQPAREGELAELVLTTLGRTGSPVIRYRTGDVVRPRWNTGARSQFVLLEGGVLGRVDDMLIVRGVNIFPSSLEQILRGFPDVAEYRVTARRDGALDALLVELEASPTASSTTPERVAQQLELQLGLKVDVRSVPSGSLPRFEGKGRRFVDLRK